MYNQEWKCAFIKTYTQSITTIKQCERIFNMCEPYETAWGADLCTKSQDELMPIINMLSGTRTHSITIRIIFLRKYVEWCVKNGYPGAVNGITGIDYSNIEKMKEMTVANPLQLQLFLDKIYDDESENTIDNTFRCFWWMAYGGFPEKILVDITSNEVDLESMSIHHGKYDAQIYAEALPAFLHCIRQTEFLYKNKNYHHNIMRNRIPGNVLVRGIRADPVVTVFRSELSRKIRAANDNGVNLPRLSYYRIWISGLFHRTKQIEDAGLPINFDDAAEEFIDGKEYKLDSNRSTIKYKKSRIADEYYQDYERWKEAHFK